MTPSPAFREAVALILKHEGGFTDDPKDPGNWTGGKVNVGQLKGTKFGISSLAYPTENIPGLTVDRAKELYHRDYWLPIRGDELPPAVALVTFDGAVNCGVGAAIRFLQRALGVEDDGKIGPVTLAKVKAANALDVAVRCGRHRVRYYTKLSTFDRYGDSWLQRTIETVAVAAKAFG